MGVSQFGLTSFCIRCVTCQLLRKGTKGTDIYILFLFLFNDVNGKQKKKPKEITAPSVIHYSSSEIQPRQRFFYDSDCHVALRVLHLIFLPMHVYFHQEFVCSKHSRVLIIFKLMLQQKKKEIM